jgi:hypothetical protein
MQIVLPTNNKHVDVEIRSDNNNNFFFFLKDNRTGKIQSISAEIQNCINMIVAKKFNHG